jgi:transposase
MTTVMGIDVSAKTLDVACINKADRCHHSQFDQTLAGHKKLVRFAKKRGVSHIVMEATGVYYLDVALALHTADLKVSVINPKAFHHFAKARLQTSKTDRIDAQILAQFARAIQPKRWQPPSQQCLALRDIARRINQLTGQSTAEKNRLHALMAKQQTAGYLIEEVQSHIDDLQQRIAHLSELAMQCIAADSQLQRDYELLTGPKGIAETSGIALLGELAVLPSSMKAKQVSCHAGMDVRTTQSGTSVNRPGRLSKQGNVYLRSGLYMPSLSFVQHDPVAKAHYLHLQARGKKKMQALCAIQRKLLTGVWACLRSGEIFDSKKLFAIRPNNA